MRKLLISAACTLLVGCSTLPTGSQQAQSEPEPLDSVSVSVTDQPLAVTPSPALAKPRKPRAEPEPPRSAAVPTPAPAPIQSAAVAPSPSAATPPAFSFFSARNFFTPRHNDLIDRIRSGFSMPELDSPLVEQHERWFVQNPQYLSRVFDRGGKYLFHIVEELEARNMPTELALLPIVESAFNPQALSRAKAAGLWQFIPSTGRLYDLKQNWWQDQRRDIVESTRAALDYLQKLYEMQDRDWFLALASYNRGENAVLRERRRNESQNLPTDYLSINLPKETRHYVPKLIALRNVLARPGDFGLTLPVIENKPFFVMIDKEQSIDLKLAARFADLSVAEFTELNPAHIRPVISASRNNRIVIPADRADTFQERLQAHLAQGLPLVSWKPYTLQSDETLAALAKRAGVSTQELIRANSLRANARPLPGTVLLAPIAAHTDGAHIETTLARFSGSRVIEQETTKPIYYRVRKKDTLASIARRHRISQDRLRELNELNEEVKPGMRLLIRPAQTQTVMTDERGNKQVVGSAAVAKSKKKSTAAKKTSSPSQKKSSSPPKKPTAEKKTAAQSVAAVSAEEKLASNR